MIKTNYFTESLQDFKLMVVQVENCCAPNKLNALEDGNIKNASK